MTYLDNLAREINKKQIEIEMLKEDFQDSVKEAVLEYIEEKPNMIHSMFFLWKQFDKYIKTEDDLHIMLAQLASGGFIKLFRSIRKKGRVVAIKLKEKVS